MTPETAAAAFVGEDASCAPFAGGHINASWLVRRGTERRFLQRINARVFPDPRQVMANATAVTAHVRACREQVTCPALLPTLSGRPWLEDEAGDFWRCTEYVDAQVKPTVGSARDAREAAFAFGTFARMLASYEGPPLPETIPGFHDTRARLRQLERAVASDPLDRVTAVQADIEALRQRSHLADLLPPRLATGDVPCRLAHNDAKITNVLFDHASGCARWVVDLDTVMPGSLLHDFGDLVRSSVSRAAEDAATPEAEPELFEALAEGFLRGAGQTPTGTEVELLESAGRLITFEQAVRFLTDHLQGDTYYRIDRPGQNLERARSQLALLESLESRAEAFRATVERLARR